MRGRKLGFWLRLAERILRPLLLIFTKRNWQGHEHIPLAGPAIFVANHISDVDPLVLAHFLIDRPREIRFLAKASLFRVPFVGSVLYKTGQIPVYRGSTHAGRALDPAVAAIKAGGAVIIYPEGTGTKDPELWPMRGKSGAARLALITGAPVIPVVQWGAHRIRHPITHKWRLRPRTPVSVAAGSPVDLSAYIDKPLTTEVLREATEVIMRRLRSDLALLREQSAPTGDLYAPSFKQTPTDKASQ